MIGETIGRYRVVEKLGQGGMCVVYKARTPCSAASSHSKSSPGTGSDPKRRDRFIEEAKAASALQHPGIVGP